MKFARRDPLCGYRGSWLWLPRSQVAPGQLHSALAFEGRKGELVQGWIDAPNHILVPRNFYTVEAMSKFPFPVYDTRPRTFPRVDLRSSVVLDAKEPSKTYQRESSAALLGTDDGILCLRCGAGKTVVALHAAAQLHVPILIIVNEKGLVEQWLEEIETFLGVKPVDVGVVGDGRFDWKRSITLAIVNTLAKRARDNRLPPEMRLHFGVVIADEAHIMGAPYFNLAVPPFVGRRWGLTATPTREDQFDPLLKYTMGRVRYTYLVPDLKPSVEFRQLPTDIKRIPHIECHDRTGEFHFGKTYAYLAEYVPERTDQIVNDIMDAVLEGRQCLVLTHSRHMCELLGERIPGSGVVHGGVKGTERRENIVQGNPVISIMQLGKQALNKPSLDTLFVCEPLSKRGVIQQIMGRVLRKFSRKKEPLVVFFEDVGIPPMRNLCNKIRRSLNSWPEEQGGRVPFKVVH